jgi:hypothetical protein
MLSTSPKPHDAKPPKKKQKSPQSKRAFCWLSTLTSKERPVSAVLEYIRRPICRPPYSSDRRKKSVPIDCWQKNHIVAVIALKNLTTVKKFNISVQFSLA